MECMGKTFAFLLERISQGQLKEAGVRGIALDNPWSVQQTSTWTIGRIGWIGDRRMVQNVEGICPELKVLFVIRRKVFENGHIHCVVPRSIELVRLATEVLNRGRRVGNFCTCRKRWQRICECARIIEIDAIFY
jgi:hypothetical protein